MNEQIYFRNTAGELIAWQRTHIRGLPIATSGPIGAARTADEKFLEDLVASHPDLLGIGGWNDETDIEGPFHSFTQLSLRALNGRSIAPDLVLLSRSGHIVVVEVKLSDNPELRDRQVVAQLLEYAASFIQYTEDEFLALFGSRAQESRTWARFIQTLFPNAPERLARRFLDKFRTGKLNDMPVHLRCVLGRVILILKSGNPGHVRQECRRSGPGSRVERRRMHD